MLYKFSAKGLTISESGKINFSNMTVNNKLPYYDISSSEVGRGKINIRHF